MSGMTPNCPGRPKQWVLFWATRHDTY